MPTSIHRANARVHFNPTQNMFVITVIELVDDFINMCIAHFEDCEQCCERNMHIQSRCQDIGRCIQQTGILLPAQFFDHAKLCDTILTYREISPELYNTLSTLLTPCRKHKSSLPRKHKSLWSSIISMVLGAFIIATVLYFK